MSPRFSALALLVLICIASAAEVKARAFVVTLQQLIHASPTIALVDLEPTQAPSERAKWSPTFRVVKKVKGDTAAGNVIQMCDPAPMSDNPSFSNQAGRYLVFVTPHEDCFAWSWLYRSVLYVQGEQIKTTVLENEPDTQPLDQFIARVERIVAASREARPNKSLERTRER